MMNEMGPHMPMDMWGPGWMLATGLLLVLLLGATAAVALFAAGGLRRPALTASGRSSASSNARALAVAKERYACGEIDHDELERVLDTLLHAEEHAGKRPR